MYVWPCGTLSLAGLFPCLAHCTLQSVCGYIYKDFYNVLLSPHMHLAARDHPAAARCVLIPCVVSDSVKNARRFDRITRMAHGVCQQYVKLYLVKRGEMGHSRLQRETTLKGILSKEPRCLAWATTSDLWGSVRNRKGDVGMGYTCTVIYYLK